MPGCRGDGRSVAPDLREAAQDVWTCGLGVLAGEVTRIEAPGVKVPHVGLELRGAHPGRRGLPAVSEGVAERRRTSTSPTLMRVSPTGRSDVAGVTEHGVLFASVVWDGGRRLRGAVPSREVLGRGGPRHAQLCRGSRRQGGLAMIVFPAIDLLGRQRRAPAAGGSLARSTSIPTTPSPPPGDFAGRGAALGARRRPLRGIRGGRGRPATPTTAPCAPDLRRSPAYQGRRRRWRPHARAPRVSWPSAGAAPRRPRAPRSCATPRSPVQAARRVRRPPRGRRRRARRRRSPSTAGVEEARASAADELVGSLAGDGPAPPRVHRRRARRDAVSGVERRRLPRASPAPPASRWSPRAASPPLADIRRPWRRSARTSSRGPSRGRALYERTPSTLARGAWPSPKTGEGRREPC